MRVTSVEHDGVHNIFLNDTSALHNAMHNNPVNPGVDAEFVENDKDEERARWALSLI